MGACIGRIDCYVKFKNAELISGEGMQVAQK